MCWAGRGNVWMREIEMRWLRVRGRAGKATDGYVRMYVQDRCDCTFDEAKKGAGNGEGKRHANERTVGLRMGQVGRWKEVRLHCTKKYWLREDRATKTRRGKAKSGVQPSFSFLA